MSHISIGVDGIGWHDAPKSYDYGRGMDELCNHEMIWDNV